jgi:hemerythrin-like domain-containing protein
MRAIETLNEEHRIILSVLEAFETYLERLHGGGDVEDEDLGGFVTFWREFSDDCHHGKEEDVLFDLLVESGVPRDTGPIPVLLEEHAEARSLVSELGELAWPPRSLTGQESERVQETARRLIDLLRSHIARESRSLWPLAEQRLSEQTKKMMQRRFELFEAQETGLDEHDRLRALAGRLADRFQPCSSRGETDRRRETQAE